MTKRMMHNDLTRSKPTKSILIFTVPILIGNLFQQLYSMVDTIIVGRTVSLQALAAVGSTGAICFLVIGFVQGVTSGFAVITAQFYGARDEENVKRSVAMSMMLCLATTLIVTALSVATTMPLLRLLQTPQDIIQDAYDYIVIIYWGIFASVLYNISSNLVRAIGDSNTPLYFLILASVLNIGLDLLFILVFHMGVAGAGWATVISQAVSGVACWVYALVKYKTLRVNRRHFAWSWRFAMRHLRVGLPMAFQYSITAIGIMVVQWAVNRLGSSVVAAYTAASKVDMLVNQSLAALGIAMATYCAQNYGARMFRRIRVGVSRAAIISIVMSLVGLGLILALQDPLTVLFVGKEDFAAVRSDVHLYLYINAGMYILLGLLYVYRNSVQGLGHSTLAMFAGAIELAMRVIAAFALAAWLGYPGICAASPVAWLGADVFLLIAYACIVRRLPREDNSLYERDMPAADDVAHRATP